jgi:hypothetical protein
MSEVIKKMKDRKSKINFEKIIISICILITAILVISYIVYFSIAIFNKNIYTIVILFVLGGGIIISVVPMTIIGLVHIVKHKSKRQENINKFDWKESVCKKLYMRTYIGGKGFNTARTLEKIFVIDGKLPADISISKDVKLYVSSVHKGRTKLEQTVLPANISYNYNYEDSENYGVYFIDDCDYGNKIEYIPANPTREGYIFDGWYKEPECINKWNYESDTLPEEIKEVNENNEEEVKFQETKLYAKWNKQ